jgi:hypothetical protein
MHGLSNALSRSFCGACGGDRHVGWGQRHLYIGAGREEYLLVRNHGVGLLARGAGTLIILSKTSKPSSIVDNDTGVDPKFSTHTTNTHD